MNATSEKQRQQPYALPIKQIVVAVGPSPHSEKTVAYAVDIAQSFGATIYLFYVHAPPQSPPNTQQRGLHEYLEEERRGVERELRNLCEKTRRTYPNCEAEFRAVMQPTRFHSWHAFWLPISSLLPVTTRVSWVAYLISIRYPKSCPRNLLGSSLPRPKIISAILL
jgi:hypothetical protein